MRITTDIRLRCGLVKIVLTLFLCGDAYAQNVVPDATEKAALLALYNATAGTEWNLSDLNKWTIADIESYPDSALYGVEISNGDVTSIRLTGAGLRNALPQELNNLTALQYLYLNSNQLSGPLPTLDQLKKLRSLDLSSNSFSEDFPVWIASLTTLQLLNLSNTQLSGPLPATISDLVNLRSLYFNFNNLSTAGDIPATFSGLDNLVTLELKGCGLTPASVDAAAFSGLLNLYNLDLSNNAAFVMPDGTLPDRLLNLPNLHNLSLKSNGFRRLPGSFAALTNLNYLDLGVTNYADTVRLGGVIDTLKNCPALEILSLMQCDIAGLPSNFHALSNVKYLYLSYNNLQPSRCEVLGQMPALERLHVVSCNLKEIPLNLVNVTTLKGLYAANNKLYPIPDSIRYIPNLEELELNNNGINSLPEWFGTANMNTLNRLVLDNNGIESFNENFGDLVNLTYLSASNNKLELLPSYFSDLTKVETLILNNNQIDSLANMDNWSALKRIELQNNKLSGSVPKYLTNATSQKTYVNISANDYGDVAPSAHFSGYSTTVIVGGNQFSFIDILKLKTSGSYQYSPQDTVDQEREVQAFLGGTMTLTAFVDTATTPASKYRWFKYIDGVNDSALFSTPVQSAESYTIPITAANQGNRYYYKITNDAATALTLTSRLITLVITCDVLPDTVAFRSKKYLCAMNFIPVVKYPDGCRTKSYVWSFGDGSATSPDKSPFHAYGAAGTYEVTMKIQYTCGICIRDTTTTQQVTYNLSEEVLRDSLISVTTAVKTQVISTMAATFSDAWPLQHQVASDLDNGFASGSEGVWRNDGTYVYDVPRKLSAPTKLAKDGTFSLETFNWTYADIEAIPHWTKANTMTQYSPFSYELENRDVLGIYSAALYDYGGHLPSANGVNMRHQEMAFTGFESLDNKSSGNWIFGNQPIPRYYTYNVYSATTHIAIVEASLAELEGVEKVDVSSRGFFHSIFYKYKRSNFVKDNAIVCMQPYPENPAWSMIVLRKSPFPGIWKGSIKVTNPFVPVISPDIDSTFAHSGKSSLKIMGEKTFMQNLLQLDSGKSYFINAWVSVKNPYVTTPKLADGLGINVIIKDKNGNVLSTAGFQPSGRIIEGWQQVKGTFVCPDKRVTLELTFKPGSTGTAWYDDLRLHPEKGNMKSYVYDLKDYRLRAILDEENFASFFYYDQEGNLYVTKKETEDGIKTISENVSYMAK